MESLSRLTIFWEIHAKLQQNAEIVAAHNKAKNKHTNSVLELQELIPQQLLKSLQ